MILNVKFKIRIVMLLEIYYSCVAEQTIYEALKYHNRVFFTREKKPNFQHFENLGGYRFFGKHLDNLKNLSKQINYHSRILVLSCLTDSCVKVPLPPKEANLYNHCKHMFTHENNFQTHKNYDLFANL